MSTLFNQRLVGSTTFSTEIGVLSVETLAGPTYFRVKYINFHRTCLFEGKPGSE